MDNNVWLDDDDHLLEMIRDAFAAEAAVPESFRTAAKATFVWRTIDAELAALTYDSSQDLLAGAVSRAEPATLRTLTFGTSRITIELEIIGGVLHGQLVPPSAGQVEVLGAAGQTSSTAGIDDVGYFTVTPLPAETFRLLCRTSDGTAVLTDWINL